MARSLNGTTDLINFGTSATLNPAAQTVSIWFNPSSLANAYSAIYSRTGGGAVTQIFVESSGKMAYYVQATTLISVDPGTATVSTGTWNHVAFAYDSSSTAMFLNGVSDGSSGVNGAIASGSASAEIGNDTGTSGRHFGGSVADLAIWNVRLTNFEMIALSKAVRPGKVRPNSLVLWSPLDGLQSPETDISGKALNGTLTGTAKAFGPPIALFTSRWPQFTPAAAASFNPAWAIGKNVIDGVAT